MFKATMVTMIATGLALAFVIMTLPPPPPPKEGTIWSSYGLRLGAQGLETVRAPVEHNVRALKGNKYEMPDGEPLEEAEYHESEDALAAINRLPAPR